MRRPHPIIIATVGVVVVLLALRFALMWEPVRSLLSHKDVPAWLQAIGGVGAVITAVSIAFSERAERRERRAQEAARQNTQQRSLLHGVRALIMEALGLINQHANARATLDDDPATERRMAEVAKAFAEFPLHLVEREKAMEVAIGARLAVNDYRHALMNGTAGGGGIPRLQLLAAHEVIVALLASMT